MVRLFFTIIFLTLFINADILYVKKKRCILDDYYFKNSKFHYTYSSTGRNASTSTFKSSDLVFGYEYRDNKCQKLQILKDTQISYRDYKFLNALAGLLLGFTVFITSIFIFTKRALR